MTRTDLSQNRKSTRKASMEAFTLVEMLVVIAIIGILAGLIIGLAGPVAQKRIRARVKAEMTQIESLIENYKTEMGSYPPDNTNDCTHPQLVYELMGATLVSTPAPAYYALTNGTNILVSDYAAAFFRGGIANSKPKGADERPKNFFIGIKLNQFTNLPVAVGGNTYNAEFLTVPVEYAPGTDRHTNTWRYVATNPTNNGVGHFDLWADINVGGKTERIGNWNK